MKHSTLGLVPICILISACATMLATPTTPFATPIPPPMGRVARIVSQHGIAFDVADVLLEIEVKRQLKWESEFRPRWQDRLDLYANLVTVHIPFSKIRRIERTRISEYGEYTVTLVSGEVLEGEFKTREDGTFMRCRLEGKPPEGGYPAEFLHHFGGIVSVDFRQEEGRVSGTVTVDGGGKIEITRPRCEREGNPSFSSTYIMPNFPAGASTLEIPLADIAEISFSGHSVPRDPTVGHRITLTLRDGRTITGTEPQGNYFVTGKTTVSGLPASFYASFEDLKSVTFQ